MKSTAANKLDPTGLTVQTPDGPEKAGKKVLIRSYGCQMNVYDANRMGDALDKEGYQETAALEEADLVILNTCHIREKASEKIYSELGKLRILKTERAQFGKSLSIAVTGCVAQAEGDEIIRRQSAVDLVIGPQNYHRIGNLVRNLGQSGKMVDTEFPVESKFDYLMEPSNNRIQRRGISTFVTIQEGCDKFCSFCVVPYTRGVEVSRPVESILEEVRILVAGGVREVTIIGQNVNGYNGLNKNGGRTSLADLIARISEIPEILRIRYTTSHPRDMSEDLINAHRDFPKLMPFLHLPVQAGSDRILEAMNRKHTAAHYRDLIGRIRAARPDIALSSDFIIGFPGESEQDFLDTLSLIDDIGFASTYYFKYSKRPGTPASSIDQQVSEADMNDRFSRLQALVEEQRRNFNRSKIGEVLEVLFEKPGRHAGQITGKTPYMQTVQVEADAGLIGSVRRVTIMAAGANSLFGRLKSLDIIAEENLSNEITFG